MDLADDRMRRPFDVWQVRRQSGRRGRRRAGRDAVCAGLAVSGWLAAAGFAAEQEKATPAVTPAAPPPPTYVSPQTVIEGGTLPQGWQPTLVPYQGVGPDGKPITVMIAPTYVFTLNPLPAQAQPVVPGPAAGGVAAAQAASQPQVAAKPAPPVAAPAAPPPSVPYGSNWVFQTQGVQPAPTGLAASSPPAPSPAQMAWGG